MTSNMFLARVAGGPGKVGGNAIIRGRRVLHPEPREYFPNLPRSDGLVYTMLRIFKEAAGFVRRKMVTKFGRQRT